MRGIKRRAFIWSFMLLVLLTPAVIRAHVIHVLIVADTGDASVGKGMAVDMENLSAAFKLCVPPQHLDLKTVTGRNVTKSKIMRAINRIDAASRDGMVFFYAGHGAHDGNGHYFALPGNTPLYRRDVAKAVQNCGAGSDTVLSNSCNVFHSARGIVQAFEPGQRNKLAPLFESLFMKSKGLTDINAASEGEYGFANSDTGSTFFYPLYLYLMTNADRSLSWDTVTRDLRRKVQDEFDTRIPGGYQDKHGRRQTTQTLRVWHLPPGWPGDGGGGGSRFGIHIRSYRGRGVLVTRVSRGSPADRAEVDRGDVILSVNGQAVSSTDEMLEAVRRSPRVMRFRMKGGRTGRVYDLEATLNN